MKLATLCYVQRGGQTLMLHRIKKENDMHRGKWNGLGGKFEPGESPEACAVREVWEESGLICRNPRLRGIITFPAFDEIDDWYTFLFTIDEFEGELIDSAEGVLEWIDDDKLLDLTLWPGDRVFIPWLFQDRFFSARFVYDKGEFIGHEVTFYGPGGEMVHEAQAYGGSPSRSSRARRDDIGAAVGEVQAGFQPVYTPEDDTYCWVCGAPAEKRHCKIVCGRCGFRRDCSDP